MPNQRAAGQKLINIPVDETFLAEIDSAIRQAGYDNRAEFVRDAVVEKLTRAGYKVTLRLSKAPPRFGKGGRYPAHRPDSYIVNEKPSSKTASGAAKLLKKGVASVPKPGAK
jgi:Arc/MetJ-type ribon-helix-helix transcriptional regulator